MNTTLNSGLNLSRIIKSLLLAIHACWHNVRLSKTHVMDDANV